MSKVNVKVKIVIPKKGKKKKGKKSKAKAKAEKEKKQKIKDTSYLMDMLFSFIGVSSKDSAGANISQVQDRLNLSAQSCQKSRQTAGTTDKLPGSTDHHKVFSETISSAGGDSMRQSLAASQRSFAAPADLSDFVPELLPVSCGYFFNIIRKLLMKQRKQVIRYLLLETEGRTFDRLLKYVNYHSLADLLMELMQLNVVYQPSPAPSYLDQIDRAGSSLADDDDDSKKDGDEEGKPAGPRMSED